jgi:predicted HicB family RNase H-like nuclease
MSDQPERRKPGRPRADEPRTSVSSWIPARDHDRLIRLANQREVSVSTLVSQMLSARLNRVEDR